MDQDKREKIVKLQINVKKQNLLVSGLIIRAKVRFSWEKDNYRHEIPVVYCEVIEKVSKMGNVCCKSKNVKNDNQDNDNQLDNQTEVDGETEELNRIRSTLHGDLETFLLDNILMSVQFFENWDR